MSRLHSPHTSARWEAVLFLGALVVYLASPVKVQSDSGWSVPLALSVVRDGDLILDEYAETFAETSDYRLVRDADGRTRSYFPVLVPLAVAPLVGGFTGLVRGASSWLPGPLQTGAERWLQHADATGRIDLTFFDTVEHVLASLATALAVLLFLRAARRAVRLESEGFSEAAAWSSTLVFAFGTSLYSSVSRLLWQQTLSIPVSCALLLFLVRPPTRRGGVAIGLLLGLLFVARPTHAVTVLTVCAYLAWQRREQLLPCLAAGAGVAVLFGAISQAHFGTWLPPYYAAGRLGGEAQLLEAAWGHLVSPARGLFVYSPVLLVGVVSFLARLRRRAIRPLEGLAMGVLLLQWGVISLFPHWWGGHGYGPRLFSDALPFACWLLLRPVSDALALPLRWRHLMPIALAAVVSVALHARGATSKAPHRWNVDPINVDSAPERLWDWSDPQFLRR